MAVPPRSSRHGRSARRAAPSSATRASSGLARWRSGLLLHRDRDVAVGGEADLVALHAGDEAQVDVVMVALVAALPAVLAGQLDALALDAVDGADMEAGRADDPPVFP